MGVLWRMDNRLSRALVFLAVGWGVLGGLGWAGEVGVRTMAGQMLMVGFRGLEAPPGSVIGKQIQTLGLGGVIVFDRDVTLGSRERNIRSQDQVRQLTSALQAHAAIPLFIAVDQEGGAVRRLREEHGFSFLPAAQTMGAGRAEDTFAWGMRCGWELAGVGINTNFAPVVDVAVNPEGPVIAALGRSFSADPERVACHGAAFARGLASAGVLPCLKHFPGHGSARVDSHRGVTDISASWSPVELIPYQRILPQLPEAGVMVGHLLLGSMDAHYPATLSPAVISGLLRGRLGFSGLVFSDDLQMRAITDAFGLEEAAVLAVAAGVDVLVVGNNLDYDPWVAERLVSALERAVAEGRLTRDRLQASWERILKAKQQLGLLGSQGQERPAPGL